MAWTPASPKLTEGNFWTEVNAHPVVVVHFCVDGSWSVPDREMSKVVREIRPEFTPIAFFYVDISDGEGLAKEFEAYQTPALLCFLNGEHRGTSVGFLNPDLLRAKLREWLAPST